jgi:hypothetical protein
VLQKVLYNGIPVASVTKTFALKGAQTIQGVEFSVNLEFGMGCTVDEVQIRYQFSNREPPSSETDDL